ncbi:MAG: AAA family ATPase [Oligoflexia bacterium]|nr:AAA family ATPase [Oligoflexia bacterium]
MLIARTILPALKASKKSILLLGPRQTGKSTLMDQLAPDIKINLAHEATYLSFLSNASLLEEMLPKKAATILVDEVQRIPSILNTIQFLIDTHKGKYRFLLTGSSARKLRRGQANLLPGRIHAFNLGTLVAEELGYEVDLKKALSFGLLPGIYLESDPAENRRTLRSYAATYLKEEVQAEALTRNLEGFSRFFMVAAAASGDFLDLSKFASEAQVNRQSAIRFFEVLEDTLIVSRVLPFAKSERRRLIQHPRYFFFDTGVINGALDNFTVSQDRIGRIFENLIFNQLHHSAMARDREIRISTYRTEHGAEVDFIVELSGETFAIEAKASSNIGKSDLTGLASFAEFFGKKCRKWVLCTGAHRRTIGDIEILPWVEGLREIFGASAG